VKFEEADLKVQGGTTFKMLAAFESWFARSGEVEMRSLTVLRMLGLFDRPADAGCVAALRKPPILAGLTDPFFATRLDSSTGQETLQPLLDQAWNAANSFLVDFGLLDVQMSVDESKPLLDCHPLIREHFAKQLRDTKPEVWRASHRRLYEHLCATTNEGDRPALRDLQPLYQAVTHGCLAGLHQEVHTDVYFGRIKKEDEAYSSRILGSFGFDLGAIACFFEQPWSRVSPLLPADIQAWYLNDAAYRLRALGRLTDAIEPFRVSRELCVQQQDWRQAAIRAINLSELGLTLGDVAGAIVDAEQSVIYADRSNDEKWPSVTRAKVADALHQAGRREAAEARFREAEKMQAESQPDYPLLYAVRGFQYCDLLLKDAERAAWQIMCCNGLRLVGETIDHRPTLRVVADRAMQALKWEEGMPRTSLLNFALHHLTLGRAALYEAILDGRPDNPLPAGRSETIAERRAKDCVYLDHTIGELNTAVGGLRGSGNMDELPRGLLTRAWLRSLASLRTGTESAQGDLDDAWEIAERGPMKLFLTDIHLHRARLFFREKPYPWKTPQADLTDAEKLINDCGYHRRDEELNDAKRAILGA